MRRVVPGVLVVIALGGVLAAASKQQIYHLQVGDPARRGREVPVALDTIVDTATSATLTPEELPARLKGVRLLLVGEAHTSIEYHQVQLRVIRALHESGRPVMVGLEMYPYLEQRWLDEWHQGNLTEEGFVKLSRWYENWGYNWKYYRDIFLYARDHGLPMYALNTPREVVNAVRRKGLANLTPEEAARIPSKIDMDSPDHMTFFKASFDEDDMMHGGMSDEAWKGMLAAQATWDASMGYNAVQVLQKTPAKDAIMVVLVGSGHVAYGLGIERQARQWFDGGIASVIPVPVTDPAGDPIKAVQASYANFVWGIAFEDDTKFPTLGLSTKAAEGGDGLRQVIQVEKDSVASRAGFEVGDVILSFDGQPVREQTTLNHLMAAKAWGDSAIIVVRRNDQEKALTAFFRRKPPVARGSAAK